MKTLFFLWLLLIGMCFVSSLPHQPIVYYCFSEDTGTSTVTDCSGNGYYGTMSGTFVVDGTGDASGALMLEAAAYGEALSFDYANFMSGITVAFRAKITDLGGGTATAVSAEGLFSVVFMDGGIVCNLCSEPAFVPNNGLHESELATWHHFAFVADIAGEKFYVYVDGVEIDSWDGVELSSEDCSYNQFFFGGTGLGSTVVGFSDEYVIFNVPLSQNEVGELVNDIDECSTGVHTCGISCQNTPGSFFCYCGDNYESCNDVDECTLGTDDCDSSSTCFNNIGSFTCACPADYYGDGVSCTACATNGGAPQGSTTNTDCSCNTGYSGDGHTTCTATHILHYSFDEAGSSVNDDFPYSVSATLSDVAMRQTTNCPQGSCVLFDSDAHEVTVDNIAALQGLLPSSSGAMSILYWAQLDDASAQATVLYLAEAGVSPTLSSYFFSDNLVVRVADSSGSLDRTASLPNGHDSTAWHHVAFVLDFDNDACVFYLDGSLLDSVSLSFSLETSTLTDLYLGHYNGNYHFRGRLDDLRIYGMRLSDDDVLSVSSVLDECSISTHDCHASASCTDTTASF
eukprot:Rmarinus@m.15620